MKCPQCKSKKLVKYGKVWSGRKRPQRYLCKICGRSTIFPLKS